MGDVGLEGFESSASSLKAQRVVWTEGLGDVPGSQLATALMWARPTVHGGDTATPQAVAARKQQEVHPPKLVELEAEDVDEFFDGADSQPQELTELDSLWEYLGQIGEDARSLSFGEGLSVSDTAQALAEVERSGARSETEDFARDRAKLDGYLNPKSLASGDAAVSSLSSQPGEDKPSSPEKGVPAKKGPPPTGYGKRGLRPLKTSKVKMLRKSMKALRIIYLQMDEETEIKPHLAKYIKAMRKIIQRSERGGFTYDTLSEFTEELFASQSDLDRILDNSRQSDDLNGAIRSAFLRRQKRNRVEGASSSLSEEASTAASSPSPEASTAALSPSPEGGGGAAALSPSRVREIGSSHDLTTEAGDDKEYSEGWTDVQNALLAGIKGILGTSPGGNGKTRRFRQVQTAHLIGEVWLIPMDPDIKLELEKLFQTYFQSLMEDKFVAGMCKSPKIQKQLLDINFGMRPRTKNSFHPIYAVVKVLAFRDLPDGTVFPESDDDVLMVAMQMLHYEIAFVPFDATRRFEWAVQTVPDLVEKKELISRSKAIYYEFVGNRRADLPMTVEPEVILEARRKFPGLLTHGRSRKANADGLTLQAELLAYAIGKDAIKPMWKTFVPDASRGGRAKFDGVLRAGRTIDPFATPPSSLYEIRGAFELEEELTEEQRQFRRWKDYFSAESKRQRARGPKADLDVCYEDVRLDILENEQYWGEQGTDDIVGMVQAVDAKKLGSAEKQLEILTNIWRSRYSKAPDAVFEGMDDFVRVWCKINEDYGGTADFLACYNGFDGVDRRRDGPSVATDSWYASSNENGRKARSVPSMHVLGLLQLQRNRRRERNCRLYSS